MKEWPSGQMINTVRLAMIKIVGAGTRVGNGKRVGIDQPLRSLAPLCAILPKLLNSQEIAT
jgi:hypothetical protein